MTWLRLRDHEPPANTKLLVLIDGTVREGYIDEILLLGNVLPTRFQTVRYPDSDYLSKDQHSYWGYDPYWMLCPEKPVQEKDPRTNEQQWGDAVTKDRTLLKMQLQHLETLDNEQLLEVSKSISQGPIQNRARVILQERSK
jgi:hypothetical protein